MPAKYSDELLALPPEVAKGRIGIVTVLYNSASVLADFFESLERQTYTNFAVYCVDNASIDDSAALCRSQGNGYRVIENGVNLGVAGGNNVGTRAAVADGCEYVLFLNNDVVFGPDLLDELVTSLSRYQCSMVTPLMYYHDTPDVIWAAGGRFQPWMGYRCQHLGQGETTESYPVSACQVSYTPTCCVLVRRELFAEIGMMDERYFVYYDDTDFMVRSWKAGKKLFLVPDAKLWHKVSSLAGADSPFSRRYLTRNQALYHHKNANAICAWFVSAIYCTYFPSMWLRGKSTRAEAFARIRDWIEGIRCAQTVRAER